MRTRVEAEAREARKSSTLLVGAVIATVIIFVLGLLFGNYLATSRIEKFQEVEEMFLVQLIALEFREDLIQNFCDADEGAIWDQKVSLGRMLTSLEKRLGKDSPKLKTRKEIYELIEIKILKILERKQAECYEDFNIILFFYTNKEQDPKGSMAGSEDQGLILDQVSYEHNEAGKGRKVYVLVFDINSKNVASVALTKTYNITKVPALVINNKLYGYLTKEEIEKLL